MYCRHYRVKRPVHKLFKTAATPVLRQPGDLPYGIDGLNVASGMSHMMGKKPLYLTMLRKYLASQKDAIMAIRSALDAQDIVTAQRIAHTLKGVSATVGASVIADRADVVEIATRHHSDRADIELAIDALSGPMNRLFSDLTQWLANTTSSPPPG